MRTEHIGDAVRHLSKVKEEPSECVACGRVIYLSSEQEKHHFPVSKINGGNKTIPLCVQCHSLVDRINLEEWPASITQDIYGAIYNETLPLGIKLLALKLTAIYQQTKAVPQELGL